LRFYQNKHSKQDAYIGWLYNNFDKNSVTIEEVIAEGQDGFYGMEFHFDLKHWNH
jgi:hypothetical protein